MKTFSRSMALVQNTVTSELEKKLRSNIALVKYILFAFFEDGIGATPKQKEFVESLCTWISTNSTFTAPQMNSVIALCLNHKDKVEALIVEFNEGIADKANAPENDENDEPMPFDK